MAPSARPGGTGLEMEEEDSYYGIQRGDRKVHRPLLGRTGQVTRAAAPVTGRRSVAIGQRVRSLTVNRRRAARHKQRRCVHG